MNNPSSRRRLPGPARRRTRESDVSGGRGSWLPAIEQLSGPVPAARPILGAMPVETPNPTPTAPSLAPEANHAKRAYLDGLNMLARRELSEAQVRQRLARKGHA